MRAYYDSHQTEVTQLCLNFIIATNQATAQTIHDADRGGDDLRGRRRGPRRRRQQPRRRGRARACTPPTSSRQLGPATATVVEGLADGQLAPPQGISVPNQITGVNQTRSGS